MDRYFKVTDKDVQCYGSIYTLDSYEGVYVRVRANDGSSLVFHNSQVKEVSHKCVNLDDADKYDHIKPKAYQFTVKGVEMDILDVIQALNLSFDSGSIMKYIARSGKKPNEEETKELRKIIEFAERKIQFIEEAK